MGEQGVFLLLRYAPSSILLSAGVPTFAFGFLDLRRWPKDESERGTPCRWQRYFFVLKGGRPSDRALLWCRHPNSEDAIGRIEVCASTTVHAVEDRPDDPCLLLEGPHGADRVGSNSLMLRAPSLKVRNGWVAAVVAV